MPQTVIQWPDPEPRRLRMVRPHHAARDVRPIAEARGDAEAQREILADALSEALWHALVKQEQA